MISPHKIHRGATIPILTLICRNEDGKAPDFTEAEEILLTAVLQGGAPWWEREVTGDANGIITMPWQAGDTDTLRTFFLKVKVTWGTNQVQYFPPAEKLLAVQVVD